jgi:hypothetical protein
VTQETRPGPFVGGLSARLPVAGDARPGRGIEGGTTALEPVL